MVHESPHRQARALRDMWTLPTILTLLGVARPGRSGERETAHRLLVEGLLLRRDGGDRPGHRGEPGAAGRARRGGDAVRAVKPARRQQTTIREQRPACRCLGTLTARRLRSSLVRASELYWGSGSDAAWRIAAGPANEIAGVLAYACEPADDVTSAPD